MLFTQFVDDDLGCASYLIGDEDAAVAAVVDPPYDIDPLLEEAERRGVRLVRAVETHTHADHVSGHGRLALDHGVPVSIHPAAEVEFEHDPLDDGDEIELGSVVLRCVHTPGHRPEHCCLAVVDRTRADEPWLALTGDSLFVGDVARPDLAVEAREGAERLFHSLQRLLEFPDGVEVYPGHVAGSLCGKAMSSKASTTIGFERRFNPALAHAALEEFVAESTAAGSLKPPNVAHIVALNRGSFVPAPDDVQELPAPPSEVQLLDARPVPDYLTGHLRGAVNVPVSGTSFATKVGFVLDPERPLVVAARDEAEAARALRGLRSVGFFDLAGYLLGGGSETMEAIRLDALESLLEAGAELLDVREKDERDDGYIAGSRNVPYRMLALAGGQVPSDRPVVTICESGARAAIAASLLAAQGVAARPVVDGGIADWIERGGAAVSFRRCG